MPVQIRRTSALSAINLTPLIDVVFLLLIFFLVSSKFAEEERELDLNLPSVSAALPASYQPDEMIINIDPKGRYFMEGSFRQLEQLEQTLRRAQANNPLTQKVIIRADRNTTWEPVAVALGLCKKVGISDFTATIDGED